MRSLLTASGGIGKARNTLERVTAELSTVSLFLGSCLVSVGGGGGLVRRAAAFYPRLVEAREASLS